MTMLLITFLALCVAGIVFSVMPVLPGPPFALVAIMLIPLWPDLPVPPDAVTWWVAGSAAVLGLLITIIDIAAPYLAKLYEGVLGKSSRRAAIGSSVGLFVGALLSLISGCFGLAAPFLAALPIPLVLITPFLGALIGEATIAGPPDESPKQRSQRMLRSAFVQWLGLLTTIVLKVGYCLVLLPVGAWLIIRIWSS